MEALKKLLDPYFKQAQYWLLVAPEKERELLQNREDILFASTAEPIHVLPEDGHRRTDPTGDKARRLVELEYEERWIKLVKEVERSEYGELIRLRREFGPSRRGKYIWKKLAKKMHYSDRWLRERWREAVYYTAFLAVSRGLVKKEAV